MPEKWLSCYATMLPRLEAEEHLAAVSEATAADSWVERSYRQQILDGWQRRLREAADEPERMSEREFKDRMAAMGLYIEDMTDG